MFIIAEKDKLLLDNSSSENPLAGIYCITSPTNKKYVGQSWNIRQRLKNYKNLNIKKQPKISSSLLKYGIDKHRFEILTIYLGKEQIDIDILEKVHFDYFKNKGFEMMNIRETGSRGKIAESTKQYMRENYSGENSAWYGRKHTEETKQKISKGNKGNERLKNSLKGNKNALGLEHTEETKQKIGSSNKGKKRTKETCEKIRLLKMKPIVQYELNGNFIREWSSITDAEINLNINNISSCVRGVLKTSGGFKWKYASQ